MGMGKLVKKEKALYDVRGVVWAFRKAVERGIKIDVMIHKNTATILKELGREGKINVYYTPIQPKEIYLLNTNGDIILKHKERPDDVVVLKNKFEWKFFMKKFIKARNKAYPIPTEMINDVFDMIDADQKPEEIIKFLQKS